MFGTILRVFNRKLSCKSCLYCFCAYVEEENASTESHSDVEKGENQIVPGAENQTVGRVVF